MQLQRVQLVSDNIIVFYPKAIIYINLLVTTPGCKVSVTFIENIHSLKPLI